MPVRPLGACLLLVLLVLIPPCAPAGVLEQVLARGSLRVGVSLFTPWTMQEENGELRGFEIAVAEKIASDMGVEPEFRVYPWEDIIGALQAGEIDLIAGGMAITPGRALEVNFSRPYARSGTGVVANIERTRAIGRLEELDQPAVTVAAVAETLGADLARRLFPNAELRLFSAVENAERAVIKGRAHVYVASMTEIRYLALEHPETLDVPLEEPLIEARAGFAVNRGEHDWLNFLNAWIVARKADRWLDATYRYWFESLDWRGEGAEASGAAEP